jgi:hypothetical protein
MRTPDLRGANPDAFNFVCCRARGSACGAAQADGQFIPLDTPSAQATKFSENGDYLVSSIFAEGGTRWSRATGTEEVIQGMYILNGINNVGTVAERLPMAT